MQQISLRPLEEKDIDLVAWWLDLEHVRRWFGMPEGWLHEIKGRETEYPWIKHYMAMFNGRAIGFAQYYECARMGSGYPWDDEPQGTFGIDYFLGDISCVGKGLGKLLTSAIAQQAFTEGGAKRLIADPVKNNIASIAVLQVNGFNHDPKTDLYVLDRPA